MLTEHHRPVDGAVEKTLPDGRRPGLFFVGADGVVVVVEFKSRIREARRRVVPDTNVVGGPLAGVAAAKRHLLDEARREDGNDPVEGRPFSLERLVAAVDAATARRSLTRFASVLDASREELPDAHTEASGYRAACAGFLEALEAAQAEVPAVASMGETEPIASDDGGAETDFDACFDSLAGRDWFIGSIVRRLADADTETLTAVSDMLGPSHVAVRDV